MKGKILGAAIALLAFVPLAASAATISNIQFGNGDVTVSGQGGTTVNVTAHIIVPVNQVVENIQTDVISDSLAPVCQSVGDNLGLQEGTHDVSLSVKLPPNTGTYTLELRTAGIFGGIRSIDCNDNQNGTASFSGALRTVDSSANTSSGGSSTPDVMSTILASLNAIIAKLTAAPVTPPAPVVSANCQAYAAASAGAMQGMTNTANGRLQGFLIGQGYSIPLLMANQAPYGFWGPQTENARAMFMVANHC